MRVGEGQSAEDSYRRAAGEVFRALRVQNDWSLREFASHVGAAHTTLYAVERGTTTPGVDLLERVATAVDLDLPAILGMIIAELRRDEHLEPNGLSEMIGQLAELTPAQRTEALSFITYLQWKTGEPRTD